MRQCRVATVAAVCLLGVGTATGAQAAASAPRLQTLAARAAAGDAGSLAALRALTAVDGRLVALRPLLQTGSAAEIHARLVALSASAGPPPVIPAAEARTEAASIDRQGRFGRPTVPDPLLNALSALGRALGSAAAATPGGPLAFWATTAAVVLAATAAGTRRALRRLGSGTPETPAGGATGEDPAALERAAGEAEDAGAYAAAVRLRYRAGLLRLAGRTIIDYRPSLPSAEVSRRLNAPEFDRLDASFQRIAYGGAPAGPADAEAARRGWKALLAATGRGR